MNLFLRNKNHFLRKENLKLNKKPKKNVNSGFSEDSLMKWNSQNNSPLKICEIKNCIRGAISYEKYCKLQ